MATGYVLGIVREAETSNPEHTGPDDNKKVPYPTTTAATVSLLVEVVLELVRSTRMTKSTSLEPAGA